MLRTVKGRQAMASRTSGRCPNDELIDQGYIVVGSPQTVIEKYEQMIEEYGLGMAISAGGPLGSMPHWMVMKNLQIMAEEVIPHFREPDGRPDHLRTARSAPETNVEMAALHGAPKLAPVVRLADGRDLPTPTGHIPRSR